MLSSKYSVWLGILILIVLNIILYWQFFLLGKIPMPGDTLIGAYFPWLDYKWGFPVGVPVKNALISDVFSQFFIWKYLSMDIFRSGQIPLWNIYALGGTPILATYHSAVLNPFNLFLFLPRFYGWGVYISAQTLAAMLGMFFLLGLYVKNFWARIFGAIIFSLSGLMTTWVEFGTGVWAAAMLPWIFLFLEKYLVSQKIRFLSFMSLAFILLYLSGHAQLTLYSTVLVGIFVLTRWLKNKNLKLVAWPGIFVILAIIFCSFQFLPTIEFTKNSIREGESYASSFNYGLNPPYEAVKFFAADFFGNPTTYNYWDSQSYHEQSVFLGVIPFILVMSWIIFLIKQKKFNFWVGVFFASLILGFENPLSKIVYSLPLPFLTYSSAARIFFLSSFSGAILAGQALDNLKEKGFNNFARKTSLFFLCAVVGITLGFYIITLILKSDLGTPLVAESVADFKVTLKNLMLPAVITLMTLICLTLLKFKPGFIKFAIMFFVVITFFDLSRYFYKYNPFIAQDLVFPKTPVIEFLQKDPELFRIARLDREIMPPNTWEFYKIQSIEGYDPLISQNYAKFFNLAKTEDYNATLSRYRELDNINSKLLDSLNVKYLLSVKRDEKNSVKGNILDPLISQNGYQVVFENKNSVIAQNPNYLPRAYFATKLQSLGNKQDIAKILSSANFEPKQAFVTDQVNLPTVSGQGTVEITKYTPNQIEFKTQSKNDEFLIFADTFNNGWKLFRNGTQDKIFETNLALRGVYVPSGENSFVMAYFPDSFKYGLWLSVISLVGYAAIFFYSLKQKSI